MARRRFSSRPRAQRRATYWLASSGSVQPSQIPTSTDSNGFILFGAQGQLAALGLNQLQGFEEGDTLMALRGYCWINGTRADMRAFCHCEIRLLTYEFVSQMQPSAVMGRNDDGNEGPSSEDLLWAGHTHILQSGDSTVEFAPANIESKAMRKLKSETGLYFSATYDSFWSANPDETLTVDWMVRGLFKRG